MTRKNVKEKEEDGLCVAEWVENWAEEGVDGPA